MKLQLLLKLGQANENSVDNVKKKKIKKKQAIKQNNLKSNDNSSQILFSRVQKMKQHEIEEIDDDVILNSDFMKRRDD